MARRSAALALILLLPGPAWAATYYVGNTWTACVGACLDDADCGTPIANSCATLEYWTANRRSILGDGDTVRISPDTYTTSTGTSTNCIVDDGIDNLTYEGRSAADGVLDDYTSVVIQRLSQNSVNSPCFGSCIRASEGTLGSGTTWRDFKCQSDKTFQTSGGGNNKCIFVVANAATTDVTIDRVWCHQWGRQGLQVQFPSRQSVDCSNGADRLIDGMVVMDSKFSENIGVFGGAAFGCAKNVQILRNQVIDNHGCPSLTTCQTNPSSSCCDNHDGIQSAGLKYFRIADNEVARNGQDGIGLGGHYNITSHGVIERNQSYDNGNRQMGKITDGAKYLTVRNNIAWGANQIQTIEGCVRDIYLYNNNYHREDTGQTFRISHKCCDCEFYNNIFTGSNPSSGGSEHGGICGFGCNTTGWDEGNPPAVGCDLKWDNNIIVNRDATGSAVDTTCWTFLSALPSHIACDNDNETSQVSWWPVGDNDTTEDIPFLYNENNLAGWRAAGWLPGTTYGSGDQWGTAPTFVAGSTCQTAASVAGCKLASTDTIAKNSGIDLSTNGRCTSGRCDRGDAGDTCAVNTDCDTSDDYDQDARVGWAVGFDEEGTGCAANTDCNDSNQCTTDTCVATVCTFTNNTDACDDSIFCNGVDTCASGICTHSGDPCFSPTPSCNEASDTCLLTTTTTTSTTTTTTLNTTTTTSTTTTTLPPATTTTTLPPTGEIGIDTGRLRAKCSGVPANTIQLEDFVIGTQADKVLVVTIAAEENDDDCDLGTAATVSFVVGGTPYYLTLGASGESDLVSWRMCAGIWYMLEAGLDTACSSTYPCTGIVNANFPITGSTAGEEFGDAIDNQYIGAYTIYQAAQAAPEATNTGGADPGSSPFGNSITTVAANAFIADIAGVGNIGTFTVTGNQTSRWQGSCTSSSAIFSTEQRAVAGGGVALTYNHTNVNRETQVLASFAPAAICGNGSIEGAEECDLGPGANGNDQPCTALCKDAACGDSLNCTDITCISGPGAGPEECDDGNAVNTDVCLNTCANAACQDLVVCTDIATCVSGPGGGVEDCDDGNAVNGDGCEADCSITGSCGDGIVNGTEQCDDGNASNQDACLNTCLNATCGDGYVQSGTDQCDGDGVGTGGETALCNADCTTSVCGDGTTNTTAGETCDDANATNTDTCPDGVGGTCVTATCGDGFTCSGGACTSGPGGGVEACDGSGETSSCNVDCSTASCGDGTVNATRGETCDDGNSTNTDTCPDGVAGSCVTAFCDDGFTCSVGGCTTGPGGGVEECDDGSAGNLNTHKCLATCALATCGDNLQCSDSLCTTGPGSGPEECDGTDDPACVGLCDGSCACPSAPGGGVISMECKCVVK